MVRRILKPGFNVFRLLVLIPFALLLLFFITNPVSANMSNVNICIEGAARPNDAVFEFKDNEGGERYLSMGKREDSNGNIRNKTPSNCSTFYSWQMLGETGRRNLYDNWIKVPTLGNRRRASISGNSNSDCLVWGNGYGCGEDPLRFSVKTNTHICTERVLKNFPNYFENTFNLSVTCRPKNNIPEIEVELPDKCKDDGVFKIRASDSDGVEEVEKVKLRIGGNIFVLNINGYEATLQNSTAGELEGLVQNGSCGNTACRDGDSVLVDLKIENLDSLCSQIQVDGWVADTVGDNSGWGFQGNYLSGKEPIVELNLDSDKPFEGNKVNFEWTMENNCPSVSSCSLTCNSGCSNCSISPSCPVPGETVLGTGSCTVDSDVDKINFELEVGSNGCQGGVSNLEVDISDPWLMTAFGDVFVYSGFQNSNDGEMAMWKVTDDDILATGVPRLDNWGYFSTYIISKNENNFPFSKGSGGASFKNYILDEYSDENVDRYYSSNPQRVSVYSYLKELSERNDCSSECKFHQDNNGGIKISDLGCSGRKVFFIDGDLIYDGDFSQSPSDSCIFIVSEDVLVEDAVSDIEAFILTDGNFETETTNSILRINGGVISNTAEFKRDLENDYYNPSEFISYEGKYLEMLRDLIGEKYRFTVKEYKYAEPTN